MRRFFINRLIWGGLIVLAGIIYLLFNIGALPIAWKPVILSWQMLLIVIGLVHFARRHYVGGFIWTAVGVVFLLPRLSTVLGFSCSPTLIHSIIWPTVIILVGILLVAHPFTHHDDHYYCKKHRHHKYSCKQSEDGRVIYNFIMNGVDEIFLGPVFRGGEINTIMGGVKLDLRKTTLPEGETLLKIDSIFGGVSLLIPEDWPVEIRTESLVGTFADNRPSNGQYVDRKLIIDANLILSGGELKC